MSKTFFSKNDLEKIRHAIKAAESKTAGEIAAAFIPCSSDYAVFELLFALCCGFIYFLVLLFFTHSIEKWLQPFFWDYATTHLVMFYGFSTLLVIGGCYSFANLPWIDRLIVPGFIMRRRVNERAMRYFMESGIYRTRDHTGILIFISFLERRVEILADYGIAQKISREKWDTLVRDLIRGIQDRRLVDSLKETIDQCAVLLVEHFPIRTDDRNELNDNLALLER